MFGANQRSPGGGVERILEGPGGPVVSQIPRTRPPDGGKGFRETGPGNGDCWDLDQGYRSSERRWRWMKRRGMGDPPAAPRQGKQCENVEGRRCE